MNELITFLRRRPDAAARLLARHVPDDTGRCRGCTTPGYGTPDAAWPCSLHWHADQSRRPPQTATPPPEH